MVCCCSWHSAASAAELPAGKSIETSMGFTPLAGTLMGTRCGDIDPAIVTFLMNKEGLSTKEIDAVMNKQSGIFGVSGVSSDFRDLTDAADSELVDPYIAVAYEELGANQDEVYFIGVTPVNDSMAADGWKIEYGPDFPILHKFTEGSTAVDICDDYQIKLFPTSILIAPDRKIVVNNIWPPTSLDNILNPILSAISNYGGGENGGGENVGEIVKNDINIYPNPATKDFKVNVNGNANVMIYDMTGRCVKEVNVDNNTTINIEDLNTGVYFVNVNGKVEKLVVK